MALLALRGAAKSFGSRLILDGLDFDVEPRRPRGCRSAPNGGGKSTLLRLIAGEETPTRGTDAAARARRRLPPAAARATSATRSRPSAPPVPISTSSTAELHACRRAARSSRLRDLDRMSRLLRRQEELVERWTAAGGPSFDGRARAMLLDLGLDEADLSSRRARSRAGSASWSGSPPASPRTRTSCCSTSPRRTSTSRRASASST